MKTHFVDALDDSLERLRKGESVTAVSRDYPTQADDLTPLLAVASQLQTMNPVIQPIPDESLADRTVFLAQMAQLPEPAVSLSPIMRLKGWMVHALPWLGTNPNLKNREQKQMSALLLKAALVLTIIMGSLGGTAVMAAESLPDSPLYPAKIAYEEARITYAVNPAAEASIHLDLAAERLREMERLMVDGKMPEDALLTRAENHIEAAYGLAEEMPQQMMAGVLVQAQAMIQTRTRALAQVDVPEPAVPLMAQTQTMLKNAGEIAAAGLQDPQLLRQRHTVNRPETAPEQPAKMPPITTIITPTVTITATVPMTTPVRQGEPCYNNEDCDPQGNGPYGPVRTGPGPNDEPGTGNGAGPGNDEPGGPVEPPEQPGPGEPNNDAGNQNQYGPLPEDPGNGSGQPGGSTEGVPIGGQNQNGAQYQAPESPGPPDSGNGK
jgi:hypothetical protein